MEKKVLGASESTHSCCPTTPTQHLQLNRKMADLHGSMKSNSSDASINGGEDGTTAGVSNGGGGATTAPFDDSSISNGDAEKANGGVGGNAQDQSDDPVLGNFERITLNDRSKGMKSTAKHADATSAFIPAEGGAAALVGNNPFMPGLGFPSKPPTENRNVFSSLGGVVPVKPVLSTTATGRGE